MKILFGRCFGLGNAVMAIPTLKALVHEHGAENVDVLVGDGPDDFGADFVFKTWGACKVFTNIARDKEYDVAIMSIPFDGRWKNGVHYIAKQVMDERPRPDPMTFGFSSWEKHEIEYQMENARVLGFSGATRDTSFYPPPVVGSSDAVYLGIGYKHDRDGFWKQKHWGNENYAELSKLILSGSKKTQVFCTEGIGSKQGVESISEVASKVRSWNPSIYMTRTDFVACDLRAALSLLSRCSTYIGNDTGMMHVAASMGKNVLGLFFMENAKTKNGPVGPGKIRVIESLGKKPTPEHVFEIYKEMGCQGIS